MYKHDCMGAPGLLCGVYLGLCAPCNAQSSCSFQESLAAQQCRQATYAHDRVRKRQRLSMREKGFSWLLAITFRHHLVYRGPLSSNA